MTNGEKIKEIFPHFDVEDKTEYFGRLRNLDDHFIKADIDFWNAEYKEPTTKNNLGVDAVSREDVHNMLENLPITVEDKWFNWLQKACMRLAELPPVTPQEPQSFKWCTNCKEYDQEKHCCHRWSKVIRNTVEEMKQEQEPRKGHWISHREHCEMNNLRPSGLGSYFWCSECDCGIDSKNFSRVNYNYCPNCGVKMEDKK